MIHHETPCGDTIMPTRAFGKRPCVAHIACSPLTKRLVPAFRMRGVASLFAHAARGVFRAHRRRGLPNVAVTGARTKGRRDSFPQPPAGAFTVVAKDTRQDGTRASPPHGPAPAWIHPFAHNTPGVIDVHHLIRRRCWKRLPERGPRGDFFLIPSARVFRDTPKMRRMPRLRGRS